VGNQCEQCALSRTPCVQLECGEGRVVACDVPRRAGCLGVWYRHAGGWTTGLLYIPCHMGAASLWCSTPCMSLVGDQQVLGAGPHGPSGCAVMRMMCDTEKSERRGQDASLGLAPQQANLQKHQSNFLQRVWSRSHPPPVPWVWNLTPSELESESCV